MGTAKHTQEFVEAANFIASLHHESALESVRANLGSSEFQQALERAVGVCRMFLAATKSVGGSADLSALSLALSTVDDGLALRDDAKLVSGVRLLRLALGEE